MQPIKSESPREEILWGFLLDLRLANIFRYFCWHLLQALSQSAWFAEKAFIIARSWGPEIPPQGMIINPGFVTLVRSFTFKSQRPGSGLVQTFPRGFLKSKTNCRVADEFFEHNTSISFFI